MQLIDPIVEIDGVKCFAPELMGDYSDYIKDGFDLTARIESKSFWVKSRNRILKYFIKTYADLCKISTNRIKLLELGSCTGSFLSTLHDLSNIDFVGSDLYIDGLIHAQRKWKYINWIQFDSTKIPFKDEFDLIGAFDVIEHIDDDVLVLSNLFHAMQPGGYLILSVPQYQFLFGNLDRIVKHKRRYHRKDLADKVTASGFIVERVTSYLFVLFPLMLVSRLFDKLKAPTSDDTKELNDRITFPPLLNSVFDLLMKCDELLIRLGFNLPFGGSLILVAKKGH